MYETVAGEIPVPCPRCRQPTGSLKRFAMVEWFVCLIVFFWARRVTYTACPGCMRILVLQRVVFNLIPANVAMFGLGPIYLVQFFLTFAGGHSKEIQQALAAAQAGPRPPLT